MEGHILPNEGYTAILTPAESKVQNANIIESQSVAIGAGNSLDSPTYMPVGVAVGTAVGTDSEKSPTNIPIGMPVKKISAVTKMTKKEETKKRNEAFHAILSFVNDLWDAYGNVKKVSPLALYHRLISGIKVSDTASLEKVVSGFKGFLDKYELFLIKGETNNIPQGTIIRYGENQKIAIEIQKFLYISRNDKETNLVIRHHLLAIGTILNPSEDKLSELENIQKLKESVLPGIDTSTKEGQFINDILEDAKTSMENIDTSNPMAAMMALYQGGAFQKMVKGMQSGEMNPRSLAKMMKKTLNTLIPDDEDETENPSEDTTKEAPKE